MSKDKFSIILPTYNEKDNLPLMISMINASFEKIDKNYLLCRNEDYEVIIVEDSSPDGTLEVAKQLRELYGPQHIKILQRAGKLGLGSAYVDGLKLVEGNFVFLMDADMSHHPKFLANFIRKQRETNCDIVTGTRYSQAGGVAGWDLKRVLTSRGANLLANLLLTPGVSDLTGSYRLYKKEVIVDLMQRVKGRAYVFQMEIIVRAVTLNYRIQEVPIVFVDRIYGESKLGAMEIVAYAKSSRFPKIDPS